MTHQAMLGSRPVKTKAELKLLIQTQQTHLWFKSHNFSGGDTNDRRLDDMLVGRYNGNLSIVGPDPERDRRWYATITAKDGKVSCT